MQRFGLAKDLGQAGAGAARAAGVGSPLHPHEARGRDGAAGGGGAGGGGGGAGGEGAGEGGEEGGVGAGVVGAAAGGETRVSALRVSR